MAIKTFKPYTPARRNMTVSGFDGVDKKAKPERSLVETLKKNAGRNSYGHITVRHRGGGNKRKYRIIDFKRNKTEIKAAVEEIFGVKVSKVNTVRMQGKVKRTGAYPAGRRAAYKKAIVTLTADSKTIEFFEGMV